MNATSLIDELRRMDPEAIHARLDEIAAEEKALREALRLINRARKKPPREAASAK